MAGTFHILRVNRFSGVQNFSEAAKTIQRELNASIDQQPPWPSRQEALSRRISFSFTGSIIGDLLQITSVSSGAIELGAEISGPDGSQIGQIVTQRAGTPGGPGLYTLFAKAATVSSETMTETYGVLTVGSVISGTVAVGEKVTGAGDSSDDGNRRQSERQRPRKHLAGQQRPNGRRSLGESMTMTATPLVVNYNSFGGATARAQLFRNSAKRSVRLRLQFIDIELRQRRGGGRTGPDASVGSARFLPGGTLQSAAVFMNNLVQTEYSQFGSFQATWETLADLDPEYLGDLAAWAQSTGISIPS